MVYDSGHSQIVLFGGFGAPAPVNDTWVWDGADWIQKFPKTSPPARAHPAMAYDPVHGQVLLFGGEEFPLIDGSLTETRVNDTWTWDGENWSQQSPSDVPSAYSAPVMAYDSARSQIVLLDDEPGSGNPTETWVWDGSNWNQKFPQTNAPSDGYDACAYDAARSQIVVWQSSDFSTWVWDGANWTKKTSQLSPPSSAGVAEMAYDSIRRQVLFVSDSGTWIWDGTEWQKAQLNGPAPTQTNAAMAYDAAHDRMVFFGGGGLVSVTNDTWTWQGGPPPPPLPTITGIVSAAGFGGFSAVAPGSWVEIYGSNLAPDTRQWAGSDFSGNNAPTSLDGVQVSIGGQKAFIDYISSSPGQVNAQLPSNIASGGQLGVTVSNANGTSAPFNITANATEPGLLAPSAFAIGGKQYAVALFSDGATYVLPTGAIPGVASRPAHPGETITLYGVGFGAVNTNTPAGQIVSQSNQLSLSFQLLFGQTSAQMSYAGLAPGFVGLYQFDAVVPPVPDNDLVPLTFNLGGTAGTQVLYTAVHQ